MKKVKIFWLAGESSGDLHCELIMKALNQDGLRFEHHGIGGPKMQAQGLKPLFPFERFAIMGFVEVLAHIPFILKVERRIARFFKEEEPDLVILADYPGLNLRIAHLADEHRIPVLYYICPQFWAWKHERVFKLKASTKHVACILPFEEEMLSIHSVTSSFVGHPIVEEISFLGERTHFASFFGLDPNKKWLGFLPGSRNKEIQRMLPIFLDAAKHWDKDEYEILISKSHSIKHFNFMKLIEKAKLPHLHIIDGYTYDMMRGCEVLVCTSGTVTLEAAYVGTPAVICYKAHPISYLIGKHFIRVSQIGLPNIILNDAVLPELIQRDVSGKNINKEISKLLPGAVNRENVLEKLRNIRAVLSSRRPSVEIPKIVDHLLETYAR